MFDSHVGSEQGNEQTHTVGEHVERIGYQPKGIGVNSVEQLNKHEEHVDRQEDEHVPRFFVLPAGGDELRRSLRLELSQERGQEILVKLAVLADQGELRDASALHC